MKIKMSKLRQMIKEIIKEAAPEGKMQKIYRNSYKKMIKKASSGGNKNTPPFTKMAAKPGKSGLGPY